MLLIIIVLYNGEMKHRFNRLLTAFTQKFRWRKRKLFWESCVHHLHRISYRTYWVSSTLSYSKTINSTLGIGMWFRTFTVTSSREARRHASGSPCTHVRRRVFVSLCSSLFSVSVWLCVRYVFFLFLESADVMTMRAREHHFCPSLRAHAYVMATRNSISSRIAYSSFHSLFRVIAWAFMNAAIN